MTSGVKMPPLVLRKLPPPRQKPRMPKHPWGQSRARTERLQEQELERLASRVPDQATLDLILGEYPEKYRSAVLGRIRQFLKFKFTPAPSKLMPAQEAVRSDLIVSPTIMTLPCDPGRGLFSPLTPEEAKSIHDLSCNLVAESYRSARPAGPDDETTIVVGDPVDGPAVLVDSERRVA